MNAAGTDILIIGYGNPGRGDDGLGPALAEAIDALRLPGVAVDVDYQLTVEHAELAARYEVVVFADADVEGAEPFWVRPIEPGNCGPSFSSHHVDPATVLALARDLFYGRPQGYLLGMRGYAFEPFAPGLSEAAEQVLRAAAGHLETAIRRQCFEGFSTENVTQQVQHLTRGRG